jgi:carboxymethylenebutenolidase
MMLLSGTRDPGITAQMPTIDSVMKAKGKTYYQRNYENADHGFLRAQNDPKATRDTANERANLVATKDGWARTILFFNQYLRK